MFGRFRQLQQCQCSYHHASPSTHTTAGPVNISCATPTLNHLRNAGWLDEFIWLVVWTPLKNISQLGWLFQIYGTVKVMFQSPPTSSVSVRNNKNRKQPWSLKHAFQPGYGHIWLLRSLKGQQMDVCLWHATLQSLTQTIATVLDPKICYSPNFNIVHVSSYVCICM